MKLTKSDYIKENIKLSAKNTTIILKSIEKNLNSIKDITHQIQNSNDRMESMMCFSRIREIAIENVIEKCNMFKANLDRYTIPFEDINIPKLSKYIKMRDPGAMAPLPIIANKRFRDKISKSNMPPLMAPLIIEDEEGEYYE
jgi:hypothetical protein